MKNGMEGCRDKLKTEKTNFQKSDGEKDKKTNNQRIVCHIWGHVNDKRMWKEDSKFK